jgi:hypothetical protein
MTGFLTPFVNLFVAMGASTFSAYILIIACVTAGGAIIGASIDPNSTHLAKLFALIGLFFGTVLVLAEVFPWLMN